MNDSDFLETIEQSWLNIVDGTIEFLPKILVALLLVLIGYIVARVFSKLIGRLVDYIENSKPVVSTLKSIGVKKIDIDGIVTVFTRWVILLLFLGAAVDVLELDVLTNTFDALVDFVPNILAAVIVAGLSFFAANAIYEIVLESARKARLNASKILAMSSKIAVLVFGLPLAVAQLGLDLTIITNNLTIVVGGVMLAFGLAFGLGGKDVAGKILEETYRDLKKK